MRRREDKSSGEGCCSVVISKLSEKQYQKTVLFVWTSIVSQVIIWGDFPRSGLFYILESFSLTWISTTLDVPHAHCHWACGGWDWVTLQVTRRALTRGSDGTHLRGNGDPWGPASANITAALHLRYGLRQLVRTAPICQSRVTVSGANI